MNTWQRVRTGIYYAKADNRNGRWLAMNLIRREVRLFVMLLAFWIILAGEADNRQIISGIMSSVLAIGIYNWILYNSGANRVNWISLRTVLRFGAIMMTEIIMSAMSHLRRIVKGRGSTAVCRLQLAVEEELTVTLIANAITLTPGTVTLEVDRRILTVLFYGDIPNQCPLDLLMMVERLQKPFLINGNRSQEVYHA